MTNLPNRAALCRLVLALACLSVIPRTASADWLYLSPEGMKHIDEIRKAIEPAPLFRSRGSGAPGPWYLRGIVRNVVAAPASAGGGGPVRVTVLAFGTKGVPRSQPVELNASWFTHVPEFDGVTDLRAAVGNFDQAYQVRIDSPAWAEHVLRAIDPDGAMGLNTRGPAVAPAVALEEGYLVQQARWSRLPQAQMLERIGEHTDRVLARASQLGAFGMSMEWGPGQWVSPLAIALKYRLEPGFAQGAYVSLAILLQLAALEPGRFAPLHEPRDAGFDQLNIIGLRLLNELVGIVGSVVPGEWADGDDPRLFDILQEVRAELPGVWGVTEPRAAERARAEYARRAATLGAPLPIIADHQLSGTLDPQLPLDPWEPVEVAVSLLNETTAVCFGEPDLARRLAEALLRYEREPKGPDPRASDEISRSRRRRLALGLLERLLNPPVSKDARVNGACSRTATVARAVVFAGAVAGTQVLFNPGERRFALDVLRVSGWGPRAEIAELIRPLTSNRAEILLRDRDRPEPADARERSTHQANLLGIRENLRVDVEILSAILDLERSSSPELKAAAGDLARWMEEVPQRGSTGERFVLQELNALRKGAPAR